MIRAASILLLVGTAALGAAPINYRLYDDLPKGPVGGGAGYEAIVEADASFTTVRSLPELRTALADPSILKVFIPGDLSFNVDAPIGITTDGLLLASDRGRFGEDGKVVPGALLRLRNASVPDNDLLLSVEARNVRITGLRLTSEDVESRSAGIRIGARAGSEPNHLEVDNCELFHWGYAAVQVDGVLNDTDSHASASVHHNHIHDNDKDGLGYGTVVNYKNADGVVAYNLYDENRHSVAGNGRPAESYTAAYNLTLNNALSSEYDMHGYSDYNKNDCEALASCNPYSPCNTAGAEIVLLNNAVLQAPHFFGLRGIPTGGAQVTRNFYGADVFYKLWRPWTGKEPCELPPPNDQVIFLQEDEWSTYNLSVWDNNLNPHGRFVQYVSWSGVNRWRPLFFQAYEQGRTAFGDFDGNGVSDVFYGDGTLWQVSWNGVTPWERLGSSAYGTDRLAFGDFNGDGETDVFLGNGSEWRVSWSGRSLWERINGSGYRTDQLAFGDFDGDGETDVFLGTGSEWRVSWSGRSRWETINSSGYRTAELAFGDFDGDGETDVFLGDGSAWKVSWSGTSRWETINSSGYRTAELAFGDFDGNGETDVFVGDGSEWKVSWGGRSRWETINRSGFPTSELTFGDFNGDHKTDVVREAAF